VGAWAAPPDGCPTARSARATARWLFEEDWPSVLHVVAAGRDSPERLFPTGYTA